MVTPGKPKRIGILGHYGVGNLGDETVVAILIKKIKEYYPEAEVVGFSLNPAHTERCHGIKAFPIKWQSEFRFGRRKPAAPNIAREIGLFHAMKVVIKKWPAAFVLLKDVKTLFTEYLSMIRWELPFLGRSFRKLRGVDILVVPGSGPLTDWWGGPLSHPYVFLSWTLLARLRRTKVIALSIGSERLDTRFGKRFCKWFLSMVHYRSFRDRYSRDAMEALGLQGENPVVPDQGFGLLDLIKINRSDPAATGTVATGAGLSVGICPVGKGCCVQAGAEDPFYERYRENLAAFSLWLIRNGYRIVFCHTDEKFDRPLVQEIIDTIKSGCPGEDVSSQILCDSVATTENLVLRIQRCDIIIASRYHAVVLPYTLQKPVLGISYERKIGDLMSDVGQADYHLPMDKADVAEMIRLFRALEQNRHSIAQHLGTVVADYRSRLARQYEDVFGSCRRDTRRWNGLVKTRHQEGGNLPAPRLESAAQTASRRELVHAY